jgi:hypothetical protein
LSHHNLAFDRDPIFLKKRGKIKKLGLCQKRDCDGSIMIFSPGDFFRWRSWGKICINIEDFSTTAIGFSILVISIARP